MKKTADRLEIVLNPEINLERRTDIFNIVSLQYMDMAYSSTFSFSLIPCNNIV